MLVFSAKLYCSSSSIWYLLERRARSCTEFHIVELSRISIISPVHGFWICILIWPDIIKLLIHFSCLNNFQNDLIFLFIFPNFISPFRLSDIYKMSNQLVNSVNKTKTETTHSSHFVVSTKWHFDWWWLLFQSIE